jgi:hypothetical protein
VVACEDVGCVVSLSAEGAVVLFAVVFLHLVACGPFVGSEFDYWNHGAEVDRGDGFAFLRPSYVVELLLRKVAVGC